MNLTRGGLEDIGLEDFLRACEREVQMPSDAATVRRYAGLVASVRFTRYQVQSSVLVAARTFFAWDTDQERTRFLTSADDVPVAQRRPLLVSDLLKSKDLLAAKLAELEQTRATRPRRAHPRIITLCCERCACRWIFDGNHELLRLVSSEESALVAVTEMSSSDWRGHLRVCECPVDG